MTTINKTIFYNGYVFDNKGIRYFPSSAYLCLWENIVEIKTFRDKDRGFNGFISVFKYSKTYGKDIKTFSIKIKYHKIRIFAINISCFAKLKRFIEIHKLIKNNVDEKKFNEYCLFLSMYDFDYVPRKGNSEYDFTLKNLIYLWVNFSFNDAVKVAKGILLKEKNNLSALKILGLILVSEFHQNDEAIAIYEKINSYYPGDSAIHEILSFLYLLKKDSRGIEYYDKFSSSQKNFSVNIDLEMLVIDYFVNEMQFSKAGEHIEKILAIVKDKKNKRKIEKIRKKLDLNLPLIES